MFAHPIIRQEIARSHNDDMLREAMRYRLAAQAAPRESRVRRTLTSIGPMLAHLRQREAAPQAIVEPI
jgi:hypothetical protein